MAGRAEKSTSLALEETKLSDGCNILHQHIMMLWSYLAQNIYSSRPPSQRDTYMKGENQYFQLTQNV